MPFVVTSPSCGYNYTKVGFVAAPCPSAVALDPLPGQWACWGGWSPPWFLLLWMAPAVVPAVSGDNLIFNNMIIMKYCSYLSMPKAWNRRNTFYYDCLSAKRDTRARKRALILCSMFTRSSASCSEWLAQQKLLRWWSVPGFPSCPLTPTALRGPPGITVALGKSSAGWLPRRAEASLMH